MKRRPEHARIARLRKLMEADEIGALLVTRREDVRYLTGFTGSAGSLLIAQGKPCLITDFRYKIQSRVEACGVCVLIQQKDHYSAIGDAAEMLHAGTIRFDESSLTVEAVKKLKAHGLALKGHRDLLRQLRLRKDAEELASIRTAVRRAERSFRELKRYIQPGATEKDLGLKLEMLMRDNGSRKTAFDTIVASGENGAMPHASVTTRRIRKGDLVTIDFGAEANGYFSDITRTLCIGRPSAQQREVHALVLKAQEAALRSIRPGVNCTVVDAAAREVIAGAGHGKHFGHGTGHGIGLMVHEGPSVSPLSKDRVERDMVFTIEPGVYVPGWGGVRIEDMVLVDKRGAQVLTALPRDLEWIGSA